MPAELMCNFNWYPSKNAPRVESNLVTFEDHRESRCFARFDVSFSTCLNDPNEPIGSDSLGNIIAIANSIDGSHDLIYDAANPTPPTYLLKAKKNGIEPISIGLHTNGDSLGGDLIHLGQNYSVDVLFNQWGPVTTTGTPGNEILFFDPDAHLNPVNPYGPGDSINPFASGNDQMQPSYGPVEGALTLNVPRIGFLTPIGGCSVFKDSPYINSFIESGDVIELELYTPGGSLMATLVSPPIVIDENNTVYPTPGVGYSHNPHYSCRCTDIPDIPDPDLVVYECRDGLCESTTRPLTDNYYDTLELCEAACNPTPIPGCTDPSAINYNPEATIDNGSCEYQPEGDPNGGGVTEVNGTCTVDTVTVDPCSMLEMASLWAQQVSTGTGCHETILEELVLISALHDLTTRV